MLSISERRKRSGFIYPGIRFLFSILEKATLLGFLRFLFIRMLHRKWFVLNSPFAVDIYVCFWLAMELSVFLYPFTSILIPFIFSFIFLWRLIDIIQSWFNAFIQAPYNASSPMRSLVLVMLNYVELAIIFAVIIFSFQAHFRPHPFYMFDAFFSSLTILIPVVNPVVTPISIPGLAIYYGEIFVSLVFYIVIIQRALALLSIKK